MVKKTKRKSEGSFSLESKKKTRMGRIKERLEKLSKRTEKKVDRALYKKAVIKKVIKQGRMTVRIPEREIPSVLGDENRFFNKIMEEERKSIFLS